MKASLRTCAALALCAVLGACGKAKPDYETLSGDSGRFSDLRGRWVFVNYWAEWCKPCLKELPALKTFNDQHSAQAVVLTVNFDGADPARLREQVQRLKIELPVLTGDPAPVLGIERPQGLPTTYVFDPDGKLATTLQGEQTVESLSAVLAAKAPSS